MAANVPISFKAIIGIIIVLVLAASWPQIQIWLFPQQQDKIVITDLMIGGKEGSFTIKRGGGDTTITYTLIHTVREDNKVKVQFEVGNPNLPFVNFFYDKTRQLQRNGNVSWYEIYPVLAVDTKVRDQSVIVSAVLPSGTSTITYEIYVSVSVDGVPGTKQKLLLTVER